MSHQQTDGNMKDYCDGAAYREHPFFSAKPNALQIILYYDDVEVCNPIGSKAKVHKLGKVMVKSVLICVQ